MTCRKQRHSSKGMATRQAISLERREGTERSAYNVYFCVDCRAWHVGHKTIKDRLRQARAR